MQRAAAEGGEGFERLGINAREFSQLGADKAVSVLAEKLDALGNAGERNSAMMQILGRSGAALLPTL